MENAKKHAFTFIDKKFDSIHGKSNRENLMKWGLYGKLKTFTFTFDKQFHLGEKEQFALDFFQDPNVLAVLKKQSPRGDWQGLGGKVEKVSVKTVDCSRLSVDLFDRLYEKDIVRETGSIRKCLDEYYENILISDELRKMLLLEETDNYDLYSEKERNEFLFRLFKHLCIGGEVCQFEDNVEPYISTTRAIYKDLVSVQKDSQTKAIKIVSFVLQVEAFDEKNRKLYPNDTISEQDFCYFSVDPYKRHLIVIYNSFEGAPLLE